MTGRFSLFTKSQVLADRFHVKIDEPVAPRYNIAPAQYTPVILNSQRERIVMCRWGLIPNWAKSPEIGYHMINARAETLLEKPAYKVPFLRHRCLVLADGYYEWRKSSTGKEPFWIHLKGQVPFALAGLYDIWNDPSGKEIISFSIITLAANPLIRQVHDRMPAILKRNKEREWLEARTSEQLMELLQTYPEDEMEMRKISGKVNDPANDSAEIIKADEQMTLFDA